ncbi:MAG TPA: DUF4296 domain-containing protein [Flavobacterium sp.]|jgi:hypothetical protein
MKLLSALLIVLLAIGCGDSISDKPDNLIEKDVMVDILYDLSLMDAIKTQKPTILSENSIEPNIYIYRKYKIDSAQFAQSNRYYASEIKTYKKMYSEVEKRLKEQLAAIDSAKTKTSKIDKPKKKKFGAAAESAK